MKIQILTRMHQIKQRARQLHRSRRWECTTRARMIDISADRSQRGNLSQRRQNPIVAHVPGMQDMFAPGERFNCFRPQ